MPPSIAIATPVLLGGPETMRVVLNSSSTSRLRASPPRTAAD